jgi:hypothetical protein
MPLVILKCLEQQTLPSILSSSSNDLSCLLLSRPQLQVFSFYMDLLRWADEDLETVHPDGTLCHFDDQATSQSITLNTNQ